MSKRMVLAINQYVRNATVYALKRFILFLILVLVSIIAFSIAFNQFRVRIFVTDAYTARANVILENTDTSALENFFDEDYLRIDPMLAERPYELYDVSRYDYDLNIDYISVGWIAPNKASVVFSEYVTEIKGQYSGTADQKIGLPDTPPEWTPAKYKVKLKKTDGRWYIVEMEKQKDLE